MRSSGEIFARLDEMIYDCLRRPRAFSSSPRCLEERLITLDNLRHFIISDVGSRDENGTYATYLLSQGYGAASFVTREEEKAVGGISCSEMFDKLVGFWEVYLERCNRRAPITD